MLKRGSVCLLGLCLAWRAGSATLAEERASLEALRILVLAPVEGRAVVQDGEGGLHLLRVGEALPGTKEKIVGIFSERLVVEVPSAGKGAPPRRLWLFRRSGSEGTTRAQALDLGTPPHPPVFRPSSPAAKKGIPKEIKHGR